MKIISLRNWATGVGALGVLGLVIGTGVSASYSDGATAVVNQHVGTFACTVSSTDPLAVVTNKGHTVTVNMPDILSSTSSNLYTNFKLTNSGTIPAAVTWTVTPSGTITYQPAGRLGYTNPTANGTLAPGASQSYSNVGFQWATLTNADLGKTASVSYTAACSEVPPPPVSKVSFVGAADAAFSTGTAPHTTSVACTGGLYLHVDGATPYCGNGTFPVASTSAFPTSGSFTVTTSGGTATVAYTGVATGMFTGCTTISGTGYVTPPATVTGVLPPHSIALPAGWLPGDYAVAYGLGVSFGTGNDPTSPGSWTDAYGFTSGYTYGSTNASWHMLAAGDGSVTFGTGVRHGMVAVYRGVAGIGAKFVSNPGNNQFWGAGPLALVKTDGSSWAVVFGGDGTGTFNVAGAYGPTAFAGTVNRSSAFADPLTGLADTNGGVSSWSPPSYASGDYGHGGANYALELLSK